MHARTLAAASLLSLASAACDRAAPSTSSASASATSGATGAATSRATGSSGAEGAPSASASATASADAAPQTPEAVAKRYLELGAKGDLSQLKGLVDEKCAGKPVGDVDAVKIMGARMTLSEVTTTVGESAADSAQVKYTVKGDVSATDAKTETDLLGKKVEIKASSMTMKGVVQSGSLRLEKRDGKWLVTCS